ncbi:MAG: hypothetical protein LJE68_16520 [Rhodobacter sp.]|nr:hypothetical protein [Rhodobacter sp.]
MTDYIEHLGQKLNEIDHEIVRAKARFENCEMADKVKALAELSQLRVRHDDLAKRIEAAKDKGADQWSALRTGFQEEADGLKDTIEKWLTKLG